MKALSAVLFPALFVVEIFSAEPFRAARSVHLGYPASDAIAFYNEMLVEQSVNGSYFMACGWNTGYFGIQQLNSETNKVVIFSVWDPSKGDDPKAVKTEDRVEVLYEAPGVRIKRFGGEGTGGQCMAPLAWHVGETNRFVIQAEAADDKTAYTAWVMNGETDGWRKLATFRTRTGGKLLKGLYSFVEDFRRDVRSVHDTRRALFGPPWVQTPDGAWSPLSVARFTASNAEWESKDNIDAGLSSARFFLATGGEIKRSLGVGEKIQIEISAESRAVSDRFLQSFIAASKPAGIANSSKP